MGSGVLMGQQWFYSEEDRRTATEHINDLKEGVILVRLSSDRKKIRTLKDGLANSNTAKDSAYYVKQLEVAYKRRDKYTGDIVEAMGSHWNFCDYAFFMDYDTERALKKGEGLLQSSLTAPYELPPNVPVYVLTTGSTPNKNLRGFVILTGGLNEIPLPFPNNVPQSRAFRKTSRFIGQLNGKLWTYYGTVTEGE